MNDKLFAKFLIFIFGERKIIYFYSGLIFNGKNLIILVGFPKCEIFVFDIKTKKEEIIESVQIKLTEANLVIKVFLTIPNAHELNKINLSTNNRYVKLKLSERPYENIKKY